MSLADVTALREHYELCAASAAVLLAYEPVTGNSKFHRHVTTDGVRWEAVLAEREWSATDHLLIATAAGAHTERKTITDISRLRWLDEAQLRVWLDITESALTGRIPAATRDRAHLTDIVLPQPGSRVQR